MTHPHTVLPNPALDPSTLDRALANAHIGSLLPILRQLTGETRWLAEPFVPDPTRAFEELNDGGLPADVQAEVRSAASAAILDWHRGKPAALPDPGSEDLSAMMSAAMGEPIGEEFSGVVAEQLGFAAYQPTDLSAAIAATRPELRVVIVGAGVSGLIAAINLKKAGIPYLMLDRNERVGGTWAENRYPGARVDIPSDLYSFSFRPKNWTEYFSQRDEIFEYVRDVAAECGVLDGILFGHTVEAATWREENQHWVVRFAEPDGGLHEVAATALITAAGLHSLPNIPHFDGEESFLGRILHSAIWPDDVDLSGQKVAVVGSGASAMQLVVAVADEVKALSVLQRQPQWVAPNDYYFQKTDASKHWLYDNVPFYREWFRFRLYWLYTERTFAALPVDPQRAEKGKQVSSLNDAYRKMFNTYIGAQLDGDADLIAKTTPAFPPFGKRLLIDNGWYRTLRRDNVELLVDSIARLTPTGLVTANGEEREIDVLALCTGFQQQRFLFPLQIIGRDGVSLMDVWGEDDPKAYLGLATPGFPNLFFLYGPNTNPPGGSWITVAEAQVRYVVEQITRLVTEDLGSLDVKPEVEAAYTAELDSANNAMVYAMEGVSSYYRNSAGRVVTNSPWPVAEYWRRTAHPDPEDFTATARSETRLVQEQV
ncbi:NAD(P)/FAD-dependent oxidoreductase [Arthrobacter sp. 08Y14]|uniref:flavin-containing monooxygenase n=1 Tax=Arthrobacter sp. 08Y14 TaxID=2058885 RepID=UPI000CE3B959|nr:NAD(P)/FAD-dependent oxidoreductase [Arthrobacter sp. 08Y14]